MDKYFVAAKTSSEEWSREFPSERRARACAREMCRTWWIGATVTIYRQRAGEQPEPIWAKVIR